MSLQRMTSRRCSAGLGRSWGPSPGWSTTQQRCGDQVRIDEQDPDVLARLMQVNVVGPMVCSKHAVQAMSTEHGGNGGSIVIIASGAARAPAGLTGVVPYEATKGAMVTFARGLSNEVASEGIRVNSVSPGVIGKSAPRRYAAINAGEAAARTWAAAPGQEERQWRRRTAPSRSRRRPRLPRDVYEKELYRLQAELVKMQEWMRSEGARMVVIFEGRDAASKGSTIKRVAEYLNPRVARIVALPAPTERQRTEWYFQRYVDHLPAAGELALFDRSWYNRAGVEHVMGFCTKEEYSRFLHQCPIFERLLVEEGLLLRKYWFSVSDEEQQRRFKSRLETDAPLEAVADGLRVHHPVGGLLARQGRDVRAHRHPGGAVERRGK